MQWYHIPGLEVVSLCIRSPDHDNKAGSRPVLGQKKPALAYTRLGLLCIY
ncbi:uncharacterized protein GLRG_07778 [Colletotrichum graminicola M1.001]|uniref:Uncharacterized protein n=1 Tax=Colletotrichum graminicola (strain M1.001 / M2 / FGSC 10212) TaxID=645133 RepID=E3QNM1_COLGM|nr:uncharacterized protein GLRG_07778 [Colletotrichum graminicola M1.001]EFQ32508.1 hypothetical protein GLRG_07778 [Colletotrichum graminicola M1.001]